MHICRFSSFCTRIMGLEKCFGRGSLAGKRRGGGGERGGGGGGGGGGGERRKRRRRREEVGGGKREREGGGTKEEGEEEGKRRKRYVSANRCNCNSVVSVGSEGIPTFVHVYNTYRQMAS